MATVVRCPWAWGVAAALLLANPSPGAAAADGALRLATFDVDATPPVGAALAYTPVIRDADLPLRCRGIVLTGAGEPIVLCAVDWLGIANAAHDAFREALAAAAATSPDRVAVHAVHQHDAPHVDFTAEELVRRLGATGFPRSDGRFAREVIARAAAEVRSALARSRPVTHAGFGRARVEEVASNRRILGPDGKHASRRSSTTKDPAIRGLPEGTIDPFVTALVFWTAEEPLAVITAFACHPQSYYRTGVPSPDFPGIARFMRTQDLPAALHVHFNGAGGNVAAGKYNDGSTANRMILAQRLATGMRLAFAEAVRTPVTAADVGWATAPLDLAARSHLDRERLESETRTKRDRGPLDTVDAAAWLARVASGHRPTASCLRVGAARMLHLPGELFVEYQLAAQRMRPELGVMVAAYGDYGPAYIGTAVAYDEGGYETEPTSSFVGPEAEPVILTAIRTLLDAPP